LIGEEGGVMLVLFLKSYGELLHYELYFDRMHFGRLYDRVKQCPVNGKRSGRSQQAEILRAMNLACVFYFKQVTCLQRAAATTCLLRKAGIRAELVIGVQTLPYSAHAWVEVDGLVVDDKSYTAQTYSVIARC